jgi:Malectin domain
MTSTGEFEQERSELETILNSGIFNRAPNLAMLLNYVCSKYFEHGAEQIKEYNIAVEALGRPAEFDPRADSIVRVEAHRLRKRLKQYYEMEGAGHRVQIDIPSGQYAPRFLIAEEPALAVPPLEALPEPDEAPPESPKPPVEAAAPFPHRPSRNVWIGLAVVVLLGLLFPVIRLSRGWSRTLPPREPVAALPGDTIRIACGLENGSYTDQFGNTWSRDMYFQGGGPAQSVQPIRGTRDQRLYNTRREGIFRYDIPLKPGVYELRLHFAETIYGPNNAAGGGESSRVFGVSINGRAALPYFDVIGDRDASTADIKVFKDVGPAADGQLHLDFTPVSNMPILSGIEISPGVAGRLRPIRMVAQDHGYTDKQGRYWEPDRYALGGQLVARNNVVSGDSDPDLYHGERFGNLTYVIPVADGRYRVTLHFAETWFGSGKSGGGGIGSRVFDILCNGVAVHRDFDILKSAGGPDRAIAVDIPDVVPNHQGKIVISLAPAENYASINAIEVVDDSD